MSKVRESHRYYHQPLQSSEFAIRLFSLNPVDDSYLLSGTITSHNLKACGSYVALSYEWGEEDPQVEIKINGRLFLIRHNLWLFLSVIKSKQNSDISLTDLRFWIDAICINQQDVPERNAQVSMMGNIYKQATCVLAWLGWPQGWDPTMTFNFIRNCNSAEAGQRSVETEERFGGRTYIEMLRMVFQMCMCRYWSRRWIVQEILLANKVSIMCGEDELSWASMYAFVQQSADLGVLYVPRTVEEYVTIKVRGSRCEGVRRKLAETIPFVMSCFWREGMHQHTLRQLFLAFQDTNCEVLHDKVYSLLSLASDASRIPVDYSCLPQTLLYRVIVQGDWSKDIELQILAKALQSIEFPYKVRIGEGQNKLDGTAPLPLHLEENRFIGHKILFCSIQVSLCEVGVSDRKQIVANFEEAVDGKSRLGSELEETDYGELSNEKTKRRRQEVHIGPGRESPRIFVSNNGSMGVSCSNARAGDVLSGFSSGKKLVLRVDREDIFRIIGTAVLSPPCISPFFQLAQPVRVSKKALQDELRFLEFLLPNCSPDSSTLADILIEQEKEVMLERIERLADIVSSFEAGHHASSRHRVAHFFEHVVSERTASP
ncbi:hypothetical protein EPUS_02896 [Endocarpon pusillum Z07020]|uniref:Heterokaryon incompatibility domain-containing protein n=1 Tax=Endocarpon pusillum (strain Z07020 / HMAS-L-300199) TaxID=1263415 RepID=U1HNZ9_ENDPU|nr:uncharacterized protein EPUS_02896 [Endocarpon pusillum Z07020]ERF72105.1 hypothetical protein EPUS_02896 [Endocarpon pusillum Z07020]